MATVRDAGLPVEVRVEGAPEPLPAGLDEYVFAALRAGASGFLVKDAPAEDLIDAVRLVAAGEALLTPSVTRRVIEEFARLPAVGPDAVPGSTS